MIAESVYALLRRRNLYNHLSESGSGPQMRRLALLGLAEAAGIDALSGISDAEHTWLDQVMAIDRASLPSALRASMPDWIMSRLIAQFGEEEAMQLTDALNQPAPLDLRVNTLKSDLKAAYDLYLALTDFKMALDCASDCANNALLTNKKSPVRRDVTFINKILKGRG